MNFNDLEWHDSILKKVEIDRSNPGVIDSIELTIQWPDERNSKVAFEGVQWANLDLHFNFLGSDHIAEATVLESIDDDVARYLTKRRHSLDKKANFYSIISSISEIRILANEFKVV